MTTLNPSLQIQRQEDDIRARVQVSSQAYHKSVQETQALRQEYFNLRLPQILRVRALLSYSDSAASLTSPIFLGFERVRGRNRPPGTQYHLTRYAFLFESIILSDGSTLAPTAIEEGKCEKRSPGNCTLNQERRAWDQTHHRVNRQPIRL